MCVQAQECVCVCVILSSWPIQLSDTSLALNREVI